MGSLNYADARTRIEEVRRRAHNLITLAGPSRQMLVTVSELKELTGMGPGQITYTRHVLESIGAAEVQTPPLGSHKPSLWRFMKTGSDLDRALDLEMERQMRGGLSPETQIKKMNNVRKHPPTRRSEQRVAISEDRLGFPVGAVAGPDPQKPLAIPLAPLRGDGPRAPEALVMAAKQYRDGRTDDTTRKAQELVRQLNEIGVRVPPELAEKAKPKIDARLEDIVLVLPYVEALERELAVAKRSLADQADYGTLKQLISRQKDQIQRLVTERTAQAMGQGTSGRN